MEWLNAHWWQAAMAIASALGLWRRRALANAVDTIADLAITLFRLERCEALCRAQELTIQDKNAETDELRTEKDRLRAENSQLRDAITRLRAGDDSSAGLPNGEASPSPPLTTSPTTPSSSGPLDTNAPAK